MLRTCTIIVMTKSLNGFLFTPDYYWIYQLEYEDTHNIYLHAFLPLCSKIYPNKSKLFTLCTWFKMEDMAIISQQSCSLKIVSIFTPTTIARMEGLFPATFLGQSIKPSVVMFFLLRKWLLAYGNVKWF